jgi:hypothetical protein
MVAPIYPTSAAAPLLFLALEKIARTPTPRLYVGYHVSPATCAELYHRPWRAARIGPNTDKSTRPLGEALYLDRLLAGGIVNDNLRLNAATLDTRPLANLSIDAQRNATVGMLVDVWA